MKEYESNAFAYTFRDDPAGAAFGGATEGRPVRLTGPMAGQRNRYYELLQEAGFNNIREWEQDLNPLLSSGKEYFAAYHQEYML